MRHRGKNSPHRVDEIRILGIDPGSITCGYGVIKTALRKDSRGQIEPSTPIYITSGSISLSPKSLLHLRLKKLHDELIEIIREYRPQEMVVEHIFFAKSAKAALNLGHARGIALLAAAAEGLNVYEYSALEVKKAITGYGRAEKRQVQDMVMRILNLYHDPESPELDSGSGDSGSGSNLTGDSADALALAICHLNTMRFNEKLMSTC
ncbi:MAG: crossover junction endodeoxyribonuclease RuvC [Nitrospirota bacterium]